MTENNEQVQESNTSDEAPNNTEEQTQTQANASGEGVYRSQEEFDAAFSKRLERERKKLQQELKQQAEEEARKAKMDETERLKAEKEEADNRAKAREDAANSRVIRAEAKVQAAALGVKPERVNAVLKLTDLSEVEAGDDGEPEGDAVKRAVEATLKEYPEFKAGGENVGGSGSNPANGGGNTQGVTQEQFDKMTYWERQEVFNRDPDLFRKLSGQAA